MSASPADEADVIVIGGGLAGLAAAHYITTAGLTAIVLEAAPRCGGRCRQFELDGVVVEEGCEFLHGSTCTAKRLADAIGLPTERVFTAAHGDGGPDDAPAPDGSTAFYHVDGQTLPFDSPLLTPLNDAIDRLSELTLSESDSRSVADYLRDEGVTSAGLLRLAAASYSNTLGVGDALDSLPLRAVVDLERRWHEADGDGDFRVAAHEGPGQPASLRRLCDELAQHATVHVNSVVTRVQLGDPARGRGDGGGAGGGGGRTHGGGGAVRVACSDGRWVRGAAAIVALPVTALQQGAPAFAPPLPPSKRAALASIRMLPALKLLLLLASPPWRAGGAPPPRVHALITAGAPGAVVPEMWFRRLRDGRWLASGFATGGYASALTARGEAAAVALALAQLARALPGEVDGAAALRARLVAARLVDWSACAHVRGGYSAPSFAEHRDARAVYRRAEWDGRLGFAGEASEEAMMTMSAAIDSGRRAARQVAEAIQAGGRSRL